MNCLVITPHRYGIREVAERIGAEWEEMGHQVDYELARGDAARIGPITVGTPGIALWWYRRLRELAKGSDEYDLIWTHQPVAPTLPTRDQAFWNRVIVTFHTTLCAEYELARKGIYPRRLLLYHWITKKLEERFYRRLQSLDEPGPHYTVISPHLHDEVAQFGIGPDETSIIPNGVFTPDQREFNPIRDKYDIPADATLVFSIGSLTPQKRPASFAQLMNTATDRTEDVYCVIAGKGPLQDAVEEHASDRLHVLGYVSDEDKWRWFAEADIFATLSAYEGMPIAALEALSFGVPVLLSDIPSHRNLINQYDTTGALVSDDVDAIRSAIKRLRDESATVTLPNWHETAAAYLEVASSREKPHSVLY